MNNFFFFCFLFGFSLFAQLGFQEQKKRETVDGIAAIVEKEVILKSDVMQQAYLLAEQQNIDPFKMPSSFEGLYLTVLDQMVDNLVLYHFALKDTTVFVDNLLVEETLKKELDKRVDFAGSISQLEQMFGEPLSMIRAKLRVEIKKALRIEQFTNSLYQTIKPSVLDVKNFYKTFKDSLPPLEKRVSFSVFEWPVIFDKQKEFNLISFLGSIKDSVSAGESFYNLAKKHSEDVGSASSGGRLGFVVRGSLFPEYEAVAFGLDVGEVSEPFKTELGFHIVLLEDRLGEKIKTAHILKKTYLDSLDVEKSLNSFNSFLSEQNVYNSVNKFDSLCSHFKVESRTFHGVFKNIPFSSLPETLSSLSLDSLGFYPVFSKNNNLYLVRVSALGLSEPRTIKNSYSELYNLVQNQLMSEKINELINSGYKTFYIKKFY